MRVVGGWLVATAAVCSGLARQALARDAHGGGGARLPRAARTARRRPARGRARRPRRGALTGAAAGAGAGARPRVARARRSLGGRAECSRRARASRGRCRAAARRLGRGVARTGGRARRRAGIRVDRRSGARVGRAAAARSGHREPDRQRDRARRRGGQRSWFARDRASPCAHRGRRRGPGVAGAGRGLWRAGPAADEVPAVAGWRSPRRSRATTVAGSLPRPQKPAPGSCSSCPPSPDTRREPVDLRA